MYYNTMQPLSAIIVWPWQRSDPVLLLLNIYAVSDLVFMEVVWKIVCVQTKLLSSSSFGNSTVVYQPRTPYSMYFVWKTKISRFQATALLEGRGGLTNWDKASWGTVAVSNVKRPEWKNSRMPTSIKAALQQVHPAIVHRDEFRNQTCAAHFCNKEANLTSPNKRNTCRVCIFLLCTHFKTLKQTSRKRSTVVFIPCRF